MTAGTVAPPAASRRLACAAHPTRRGPPVVAPAPQTTQPGSRGACLLQPPWRRTGEDPRTLCCIILSFYCHGATQNTQVTKQLNVSANFSGISLLIKYLCSLKNRFVFATPHHGNSYCHGGWNVSLFCFYDRRMIARIIEMEK